MASDPAPVGAFRGMRAEAVGSSMRTLLEERLMSAEKEYRDAVGQYRTATRLQKAISAIEDDGEIEKAEELKVKLMEALQSGGDLNELEREFLARDITSLDEISAIESGSRDSSNATADQELRDRTRERKRKSSFRKAILISLSAWMLAVGGLVISITFLTRSYVRSVNNPVISRRFEERQSMELPVISLCTTNIDVPSFQLYPTEEYPGHPLFTINGINYFETGESRSFPDALLDFEPVILGPSRNQCSTRLSRMNATLVSDVTGQVVSPDADEIRCAECLRIGRKSPISVSADRARTGAASSGFSVDVVYSRLYSFCFLETTRVFGAAQQIFRSEFTKHITELIDLGILDYGPNFSGVNISSEEEVFASLEIQEEDTGETEFLPTIDFYCNVYFFSGFFYPTFPDNPDVSYEYGGRTFPQTWRRKSGTLGPYFDIIKPETLDDILSQENLGLRPVPSGDGQRQDSFSLLNSLSLLVYAEDRSRIERNQETVVNRSTLVAQVDRSKGAIVRFQQRGTLDDGSTFRVAALTTIDDRPRGGFENSFFFNTLNFTYDRFLNESLSTQQTYTVPEYLVDLLEVITLFTGLSFYSVIVVPATAFLVQRQRKRRRLAIQRARALAEAQQSEAQQSEAQQTDEPILSS